jgi:hypothetical protein
MEYSRINEKCEAFEVLGSWMSRLIMWQLGLADKIFEQDENVLCEENNILWRTGRRILYAATDTETVQAAPQEGDVVLHYSELDRWVSEDGIFLHASDYTMDEIH